MLGVLDSDTTSECVLLSSKGNSLSLLQTKRYQRNFRGLSPIETKKDILSDKKRKQAAFERDYWSGLHELGLSYEEAKEISEKYYKKLAKKNQTNTSLNSEIGYANLDDLKICCTSKQDYPSSHQLLLDPKEENYRKNNEQAPGKGPTKVFKPVLILVKTTDECNLPSSLETIEYIGYGKYFDFFLELLNNKIWQQNFEMRLACGRQTVHFRATRIDNERITNTDQLISDILSIVLVSGRPIRNYNATFYLPLDLSELSNSSLENCNSLSRQVMLNKNHLKSSLESPKKNNSGYIAYDINENSTKAQIQSFFSPLLHDQLFTTTDNKTINDKKAVKPVHHYQLKDWKKQVISIAEADSAKAVIQDISLYRHELGQGLLAIHLKSQESNNKSWNKKIKQTAINGGMT